jgi:hypothetical protein
MKMMKIYNVFDIVFLFVLYKMTITDISPVGLPQSLRYDQLPSIPDSVQSYSVSVAPSGLTEVVGATITPTDTAFVADSNGLINKIFNTQRIDFSIPSGMNDNIFMDTRETTLSGTLTFTNSTAAITTAGEEMKLKLISTFSSFFDSLTLSSNNVPIEQIYNYNLLFNQMLNATISQDERYGSISISCGGDNDSFSGIDLPLYSATNEGAQSGTHYFNFCIPLASIIGLNTASTSQKLFPVGSIGNLNLTMTTANLLPIASYCTTAVVPQPTLSFKLSNFNLNMKYVNLGDIVGSMLKQTLYNGKFFIKSQTYVGANQIVSLGSSGNVSIPLQIRQSSVKSLFWQFSMGNDQRCPNGYYDAINPNIISLQVNIGGVKYPQKPIRVSYELAECYNAYLQAWGGSSLKSMGGSLNRSNYGATLSGGTAQDPTKLNNAEPSIVYPAYTSTRSTSSYQDTNEIIIDFPNCHYEGVDLERLSSTIFSGVNTQQANPFIEANIGLATNAVLTCYAWGLVDCVMIIDPATKKIEVLV